MLLLHSKIFKNATTEQTERTHYFVVIFLTDIVYHCDLS